MMGVVRMETKDKITSLYTQCKKENNSKKGVHNKCDWCLDTDESLVVSKNFFKRDMLKKGKKIEIILCKDCKGKLKDILET